MAMHEHPRFESYEEAVAAARAGTSRSATTSPRTCCDKHPPDKLAMIHEDFEGTVREVRWGELQENANRFANVLRAHGVEQGRPRRDAAAADARDGGRVLRHLSCGAILLSMSVLYGDDGIRHRVTDSAGEGARHQRGQRGPRRPVARRARAAARRRAARRAATPPSTASTPRPTTRRSSTTPPARPASPRASCTRTATCSRTRSSSTATTCRTASASTAWASGRGRPGIAPLLGPWRLGAVQFVYQRKGGFDPHKQLDFALAPRGHERLHDADRDALDDVDRATPARATRRSSASSARAGEPLNPEAIRWFREQYGLTVLDYYGLTESYPLVANYPFMEVREGSMGKPMPGWDVQILDEDEKPLPQGERGEICLRARSNPHYPLGYWRNDEASEETFGGEWFHTKDAAVAGRGRLRLVRGPRRRRDHRGRLPDRPVRGRVRVPRAPGGGRGGGGRLARRAPRQRRQGVHRAGRGPRAAPTSSSRRSRRTCATACRRYAYPRKIEFVDELPKTLTGKIRRIELRQAELEAAKAVVAV